MSFPRHIWEQLVLAVVALWGSRLNAHWDRPRLSLLPIAQEPPYCHKIPITLTTPILTTPTILATTSISVGQFQVDSYYFRFKVYNGGNTSARNVEVFAESLSLKHKDGRFRPVSRFLPMNLKWAHFDVPVQPWIAPKTWKLCGLAHILEPAKRKEVLYEDDPVLAVRTYPQGFGDPLHFYRSQLGRYYLLRRPLPAGLHVFEV